MVVFLGWLVARCAPPSRGARTQGVIVRRPTMFGESLVASTTDRRSQSARQTRSTPSANVRSGGDRTLPISARYYLAAFSDAVTLGELSRQTLSVGVRRDMTVSGPSQRFRSEPAKPSERR